MMNKLLYSLVLLSTFAYSQSQNRFAAEVEKIQKKYGTLQKSSKETIVFTGSSSIRVWHDLQERFPDYQIINSGFGGSHASDLVQYSEELILRYNPKKVFIYEGDNDIASGKSSKKIITEITTIIEKIKSQNRSTQIVLISTKPSIARWNLRKSYERLNRSLKKITRKDAHLYYADVWKPMIENKKVKKDIFKKDGLHMNSAGYAIWYNVLKPYVEK